MKKNQRGFTLIELMVVTATIGVLASIALPQFKQYRKKGFDDCAKNDLYNAALAEEAYFADNNSYKSCTTSGCAADLPGLKALTPGVELTMQGTASGFTGTATHPTGSGTVFTWDSSTGGVQG